MKAELVPENGDPPIPITRDVTVVGRRPYCDVFVDDPSLSKRHCVIVKTDGLLVVRDLATTNGTKVKGQRVRWAALMPDDRLTLGGYKVRVYLGPDHVPGPSERPSHAKGAAALAPPAPRPAGPAPPPAPSAPNGFATPTPAEGIPTALDDDDLIILGGNSESDWKQLTAGLPPSPRAKPTDDEPDEYLIELD